MPAVSLVFFFLFLEELEEQAARKDWITTSDGGQQEYFAFSHISISMKARTIIHGLPLQLRMQAYRVTQFPL